MQALKDLRNYIDAAQVSEFQLSFALLFSFLSSQHHFRVPGTTTMMDPALNLLPPPFTSLFAEKFIQPKSVIASAFDLLRKPPYEPQQRVFSLPPQAQQVHLTVHIENSEALGRFMALFRRVRQWSLTHDLPSLDTSDQRVAFSAYHFLLLLPGHTHPRIPFGGLSLDSARMMLSNVIHIALRATPAPLARDARCHTDFMPVIQALASLLALLNSWSVQQAWPKDPARMSLALLRALQDLWIILAQWIIPYLDRQPPAYGFLPAEASDMTRSFTLVSNVTIQYAAGALKPNILHALEAWVADLSSSLFAKPQDHIQLSLPIRQECFKSESLDRSSNPTPPGGDKRKGKGDGRKDKDGKIPRGDKSDSNIGAPVRAKIPIFQYAPSVPAADRSLKVRDLLKKAGLEGSLPKIATPIGGALTNICFAHSNRDSSGCRFKDCVKKDPPRWCHPCLGADTWRDLPIAHWKTLVEYFKKPKVASVLHPTPEFKAHTASLW